MNHKQVSNKITSLNSTSSLNNLIPWPKDSAGLYLTDQVAMLKPTLTVSQTKEYLNKNTAKLESINYLYLVDDQKYLVGIISIKELYGYSDDTVLKDVCVSAEKLATVRPSADREKVAMIALKNSIKSVPVVDKKGVFLGIVPADKIQSILYEEQSEDQLRMSGILHEALPVFADALSIPVGKAVAMRTPWLLIGLVGGVAAAKIIVGFEEVLQENLILAFFIPLIVYISDAVGTQMQTLIIRDLAISKKFSIVKYTLRQVFTSAIIGLICGLAIFLMVLALWHDRRASLAIGVSVFAAISSSVVISLTIPYSLYKLKQDPAVASGPLATILQDIASVLIYFAVATAML